MSTKILMLIIVLNVKCFAQNDNQHSPIDALSFGVVLDDPGMKNVLVKKDITYLEDSKGILKLDIYTPPKLKANEKRPAIIFLNAIGENGGERKVKSWGIYSTWPKLMAANGYIGISMETDGSRVQESIQGLFAFLDKKGSALNINKEKLGVYAASSNVTQSVNYLMGEKAYNGIRAAVLYYGGMPSGPFRKDLPVLFVVSEGDVARNGYNGLWNEVLKNNAPWTIRMGTGMPHAFDAYSDNDEARKIIKETISFWKDQLDVVATPSWPHSKARDVHALIRMNFPKALQLLEELKDEYPGDIPILSFYAEALREAKRIDESVASYKKVLSLEPTNVHALIVLASISYSMNKNDEAENYVSLAEKTGKMGFGSYGDLAFSLLVNGKDKEAAKYYEKSIALQPNGHDYYNLACAYAKSGDKERAYTALEKSVEIGYSSRQLIENDTDLVSLRSDERYKAILSKLK